MLITVEGLDGSGKTTVWESLQETYPDAVFTREPTASWYGEAVNRSINADDADPLAELFLYTADHADHLSRVVRPALADDELVISDRYSDSRYAYQGATLADSAIDDPIEYVRSIHEPFSRRRITPSISMSTPKPPPNGAAGRTNSSGRRICGRCGTTTSA